MTWLITMKALGINIKTKTLSCMDCITYQRILQDPKTHEKIYLRRGKEKKFAHVTRQGAQILLASKKTVRKKMCKKKEIRETYIVFFSDIVGLPSSLRTFF